MYQVYLATEIPDITQNYINSHVFTCRHWVSAILIQIYITLLELFLIGQIFFYSEGLVANQNVSRKLSMKLAIGSCKECDEGGSPGQLQDLYHLLVSHPGRVGKLRISPISDD